MPNSHPPLSRATSQASRGENAPKNLDRLLIPGMTVDVPGYDGGVPAWLLEYGLTVHVAKNWAAQPGDIIVVGDIRDPLGVKPLVAKELEPGEELKNGYTFALQKDVLPDGEWSLGYVVYYGGGLDHDLSYPLHVLVKTDVPGGDDNDQAEPGHSELKFSLSETQFDQFNAPRGATITVQPYPNMHPLDVIYAQWSNLLLEQQVKGVGEATVINVSYANIVEAGDGPNLLVNFYVIDQVGNISWPSSREEAVLVDLDTSKVDGPAFRTNDPFGYIDLERLNGESLILELYTEAEIGKAGDEYDVVLRAYPAQGGVIVHRDFEKIVTAGRPVLHAVPYDVIRSAAGGRVETSFVLRRRNDTNDVFSTKTSARVLGSIVRLTAPQFEGYPDHIVRPIPEVLIVDVPWYAWRKPTDEITLILRLVRTFNDIVVYSETRTVGSSWPDGAPVRRLIRSEDLEQFRGTSPELYYVYTSTRSRALSESTRARLPSEILDEAKLSRARPDILNESLRQVVRIG